MLAILPPVLSMGRGVLRLAAIMEVLPEWKTKLLADGWIWTFLAAIAPVLALWNTVVALFNRQIRWRGIRYQLLSPGQTHILIALTPREPARKNDPRNFYPPDKNGKCADAAMKKIIGKLSQKLICMVSVATRVSFAASGGMGAPCAEASRVHTINRF